MHVPWSLVKAFELMNAWPCPTVAAAVIDREHTVHRHGDTATSFSLASVTKLFTAAAAHLAVEEGTISLSEVTDDRGATISDLLGHASGLAPDGRAVDEPGRRRVYSNAGYDALAGVVEAHAEMPFRDYLTEGIFQPLGMVSTQLTSSPAFGATSTVDDLVRFVTGLDTILAPETLELMTEPYLPELIGVLPGYGRQVPNTWGLGPEIRGTKHPHWTGDSNSPKTWGHFGAAGTFVWTDPEVDASMIVLTDRDFGDWAIPLWTAVSDAVLGELAN